MPEEANAVDTPLVADTPEQAIPAGSPDAPGQIAAPATDESMILSDMGLGTAEKEPKPKRAAKEEEDAPSPETPEPEHPDSERMMRADYLKKLNLLNKEKEELERLKQELQQPQRNQRVEEPVNDLDDDDYDAEPQATNTQGNPFSFLAENPIDGLDPDDFDDTTDSYMAHVLKDVGEHVNNLKSLVVLLLQEREQGKEMAMRQHAQTAMQIMDNGVSLIERTFGIRPTSDEVGQAILDYGPKVVERMGGVLTPQAAFECWKMANVDLLLGSIRPQEDQSPRIPETASPTASRTKGSAKTDEEKILQDVLSQM